MTADGKRPEILATVELMNAEANAELEKLMRKRSGSVGIAESLGSSLREMICRRIAGDRQDLIAQESA